MVLLLRRRSLWLKAVFLLGTAWLTVAVLLYSEQRAAAPQPAAPPLPVPGVGHGPGAPAPAPALGGGAVGGAADVGAGADQEAGVAAALAAAPRMNAPSPQPVPAPRAPYKKKGARSADAAAAAAARAAEAGAGAGAGGEALAGVLVVPRNGVDELNAPGENGRAVTLPTNISQDLKQLVDEGWAKNAFNQYVSDLISVRRTLPDPRDSWCKEPGRYLPTSQLPTTSVIICFHNEAWTVLLRTVHSVLDRSPPELLKEIILVDDFSDMHHTARQLEDYMENFPKVKILRATKREGLIRARLLGARHATAPVLTYLDSHCECTVGWLEPLLDRIARDPHTVVCPVIDVIDDNTLEYHWRESGTSGGVNVGGFDWNLQFNWHSVPERERKRHNNTAEPVWSPTMAGGLFSIDKAFFEQLGTYDSGFDIWGGENLELSFKTWMCGGTLEIVPCSHVGHIFRKRSPYKWRSGVNVLKRNSVRLAQVWMDDYAKYFYQRVGFDLGEYGDVSARRELRKKLGCKSFQWYLDNIYPELFIPGEAVASGEIANEWSNQCVDSPCKADDMHKPVGLWPCHKQGGNQYWMLSKIGEIRRDDACLDYSGYDVILYPCHGSKGNQFWQYNPGTQLIQHGSSKKCLGISENKLKLIMSVCDKRKDYQRWTFANYDPSKL